MAYAFSVSTPVIREVDDARHCTWTVTETGPIAATDEWTISGVPTPSTLTLLEAELVDGDGATTIRPEIGYEDGFDLSTLAACKQAASAAAYHRVGTDERIPGLDVGQLVGRSMPNTTTGNAGEVVTRVTVRVGH